MRQPGKRTVSVYGGGVRSVELHPWFFLCKGRLVKGVSRSILIGYDAIEIDVQHVLGMGYKIDAAIGQAPFKYTAFNDRAAIVGNIGSTPVAANKPFALRASYAFGAGA